MSDQIKAALSEIAAESLKILYPEPEAWQIGLPQVRKITGTNNPRDHANLCRCKFLGLGIETGRLKRGGIETDAASY